MISLIAAVAVNRVIGKDNRLLWRLPEDLRHFREVTRGKPVIMGRKTWESLPDAFRPLPGRLNIVVTRDPAYVADGATLAHSLDAALAGTDAADECFVIGGEKLYRQAMPLAERLYLTEIDALLEGDVHFPEVRPELWEEISRQPANDTACLSYSFAVYRRR